MVVTPKHEEKGGSHEVAKNQPMKEVHTPRSVATSDKNVVDLESDENVRKYKNEFKRVRTSQG